MGNAKVNQSPRTDGSKALLLRQWRLRAVVAPLLMLTAFPFLPYAEGLTLYRFARWLGMDLSDVETSAWYVLVMAPAVLAAFAALLLLPGAVCPGTTPSSRRALHLPAATAAFVWLVALAIAADEITSGRLVGSVWEGWLAMGLMYAVPLVSIAVAIRSCAAPARMATILAGALNLSLVCFLLLHAGAGNLTAFAWGFVTATGLVAGKTGFSDKSNFRIHKLRWYVPD